MTEMILSRVENDSSIEITKNTKGFTWSIKAYGSTPREVEQKLLDLKSAATNIVKQLSQDEITL